MNAFKDMPVQPQMPAEEFDDEIDLKQYWSIINKHKWGIISFVVAVVLLALPVVFSLTPVYQSKTTLLIDPQEDNVVDIERVYGMVGKNYEYFDTQIEVLKSRSLAEKVVGKLNLHEQKNFFLKKKPLLGFDWRSLLPEGWQKEKTETRPTADSAVGTLMGNLTVSPVKYTQVVNIQYASHDPNIAALVSNTLAETYIESDLEARLAMTEKAASWLTERLKTLRQNLEKSEQALQAYKEQEKLVDVSGVKSLSASRLNVLNQKLVEARRERAEAQSTYEQVTQARNSSNRLYSLPVILNNTLLQDYKRDVVNAERAVSDLQKRYGPKHPKMIKANSDLQAATDNLNQQLQDVINGVRKQYETASTTVRDLENEVAAAKQEVQGVDQKQYQLGVLQREVEANRSLYDLFLTRFKETSEAGGIESANARVLDPARIPDTPYKPDKRFMLSVTALLALLFAVGVAFLYERLDDTIKGSADVENKLGLPVLGLLQRLKTRGKRDRSPLRAFIDNDQSAFAESIRTIRTGVLLSSLDNPHKIIVVTSSMPGEGKSTVAMNLAHALSHMSRVLVIDADMRRPSIAMTCDLGADAKGLSQFTAGTAEVSETINRLPDTNLDVMPAGLVPPNPLELLSSNKFKKALEALSEEYDHIVIDTAPTVAVSDALVISSYVNALIYVVQADSTPYQVAQAGVKRLKQVGAPIIGVVLNKMQPGKKSRYGYYGADYYSGYGYDSKS
jgi:capsular exopolysaccharide synthesis family protein